MYATNINSSKAERLLDGMRRSAHAASLILGIIRGKKKKKPGIGNSNQGTDPWSMYKPDQTLLRTIGFLDCRGEWPSSLYPSISCSAKTHGGEGCYFEGLSIRMAQSRERGFVPSWATG